MLQRVVEPIAGDGFGSRVYLYERGAVRVAAQEFAIRAGLSGEHSVYAPRGGIEEIECGNRLVELEMFGAEQYAAIDGQAIVNDYALVAGDLNAGVF